MNMASQSFSFVARSTFNLKNFQTIVRRHFHSGSSSTSQDPAKRGLNEALRTGENLKNHATSATENIAESTKESAHGVADKAKQAAQGAWESTKETAHNTKENVFNKSGEVKESVKETAKRSMNTKNNPNV